MIHGAPPWAVTYTLELDAAPVDERVVVSAPGTLEQVGGTAKLVTDAVGMASILVAPGCAIPPSLGWHSEVTFHSISLDLPAGTAGFITMSRTRTTFPTAMDDLGYTFYVATLAADDTVTERLTAALPGPAIALPRRPQLRLTSRDVPRFGALFEGSVVRIRGFADSALSGQHVELRYAHTTDSKGRPKLIARVPVGRNGSFAYRWRVPGHGRYSVSARYRSQDSRFVSTQSECLLGFYRP